MFKPVEAANYIPGHHFSISCHPHAVINWDTNEWSCAKILVLTFKLFFLIKMLTLTNSFPPLYKIHGCLVCIHHLWNLAGDKLLSCSTLYFSKYCIISCYLFQFRWGHLVLFIAAIVFRHSSFYFLSLPNRTHSFQHRNQSKSMYWRDFCQFNTS